MKPVGCAPKNVAGAVVAWDMAKAPPRKLRWDRVLLVLIVLGGGAAAAIYFATK
ncbi:MAG TPA: hypothetical protein VN253_22625 [Kofleriaceae bacterium]|nr:hypothetical protein [Kofleriaceae bacterium]